MIKFYITWSNEEPSHPKDAYEESWNSGVYWNRQINPPDKSLNQRKQEEVNKYTILMKNYRDNGKIKKLNQIFNPTEKDIQNIETDINFIEWCN
jgi:hypothetical protein